MYCTDLYYVSKLYNNFKVFHSGNFGPMY